MGSEQKLLVDNFTKDNRVRGATNKQGLHLINQIYVVYSFGSGDYSLIAFVIKVCASYTVVQVELVEVRVGLSLKNACVVVPVVDVSVS